MNNDKLKDIVEIIFENGKGILAMDESPGNVFKKFKNAGIEQNDENRRLFREILLTTPNLEKYIGGAILHDETFNQATADGTLFLDILERRGIVAGIKLDKGLISTKVNENISQGMEDLESRLKSKKYKRARFGKWRVTFFLSKDSPSMNNIDINCRSLAEYAKICQNQGLVPIVEPEILYDGSYGIERAKKTSKIILSNLMFHLGELDVYLPGLILKPSFVSSGKASVFVIDPKEVSAMTYAVLIDTLPLNLGGVAFLSGGHRSKDVITYLDCLNTECGIKPWPLSFSFGRALTNCVIDSWQGYEFGITKAHAVLQQKLYEATLAVKGEYLAHEKQKKKR